MLVGFCAGLVITALIGLLIAMTSSMKFETRGKLQSNGKCLTSDITAAVSMFHCYHGWKSNTGYQQWVWADG